VRFSWNHKHNPIPPQRPRQQLECCMAKEEIFFVFFALSVLFAGWLWLQDPSQEILPSWEEWLYNNGLKGAEIDFKEHGGLIYVCW